MTGRLLRSRAYSLASFLAGGGFARIAMLLVLMRPLDRIWDGLQNHSISLCVYVDDIAVHIIGTETGVASGIAAVSQRIVDAIEKSATGENRFPRCKVCAHELTAWGTERCCTLIINQQLSPNVPF